MSIKHRFRSRIVSLRLRLLLKVELSSTSAHHVGYALVLTGISVISVVSSLSRSVWRDDADVLVFVLVIDNDELGRVST